MALRTRLGNFRYFRYFRQSFWPVDSVGLLALLALRGRRHDVTAVRQERGVVAFDSSTRLTMAPILLPDWGNHMLYLSKSQATV
jgi:hypothetical protein